MKFLFVIGLLLLGSVDFAFAQSDPAAAQDAEAARKKLLRAADQIDILQAAVDNNTAQIATLRAQLDQARTDLDAAKADLATLKTDNAALHEALQKLDAVRAEERKVLLDEVSKIVADASKHAAPAPAPTEEPKPTPAPAPAAETQKGFDYIVVKGDTLHAIAEAYSAQGVHVTVADLRQANNLSKTDTIHVGQKLFIPKK